MRIVCNHRNSVREVTLYTLHVLIAPGEHVYRKSCMCYYLLSIKCILINSVFVF